MKKVLSSILAIMLAFVMVLSLASCAPANEPGGNEGGNGDAADWITLNGKEYGEDKDYISLYEKYGNEVTIADVTEDETTGKCYITKDGKQYELGLDFLSRAMVYNVDVPEGSDKYKTADDVYAQWWKLYIQRWNYMMPEVPLYANQYYDLYNAKITGVKEHPTNPYWSPSNAVIDWASTKDDKSIILGSTTELSGKFRYAVFGGINPGAADLDIQNMISGLDTVTATKEGGYVWNDTVVKAHSEVENDDGTKTFTIEIYDDLKFSDGSAITAKNYVVHTLVFSTPVAAQAAGKDHTSGLSFFGYEDYAAYTGEGDPVAFAGIKLEGDYKFSVTVAADFLPYFYDVTYASFSPVPLAQWLGTSTIETTDAGNPYIAGDFWKNTKSTETVKDAEGNVEKNEDGTDKTQEVYDYSHAAHIKASASDNTTKYPCSGPWYIESYDAGTKTANLKINPYFKGNYEGVKPTIEKVTYVLVVSTTQLDQLKAGQVDVIAGITGGDETDEALKLVTDSNGAFDSVTYARAGYGKLGFRADFGPAQFLEVRQAIAYCMDRAQFAKDFTGGYGGVVDGPYYTGSWMYQAVKDDILLNSYATSVDSAVSVLEAGGWIYNAEGKAYTEGVRYKKIPGAYASENDINYQSKDGTYKTTKVGEDYYMPLVINWYGTSDNPFTDQLITGFMNAENIKAAGFVVQNQIGDFNPMLDELYQAQVYGYYSGTPMYSAFNFATGFTSAIYDYSYNLTIIPSEYDNYSAYYLKDMADVYWIAK